MDFVSSCLINDLYKSFVEVSPANVFLIDGVLSVFLYSYSGLILLRRSDKSCIFKAKCFKVKFSLKFYVSQKLAL